MPVEDWATLGNCAGLPDSVFFPPDTDEEDAGWYSGAAGQEAIAVCRACVVRTECFDYALEDPYTTENGVFGGTTPEDRRKYGEALSIRAGLHPSRNDGADQG